MSDAEPGLRPNNRAIIGLDEEISLESVLRPDLSAYSIALTRLNAQPEDYLGWTIKPNSVRFDEFVGDHPEIADQIKLSGRKDDQVFTIEQGSGETRKLIVIKQDMQGTINLWLVGGQEDDSEKLEEIRNKFVTLIRRPYGSV